MVRSWVAWLLFLLVDCLLLLDDLCELDVLLREVLLDRLLDFLVTFPPLDGLGVV